MSSPRTRRCPHAGFSVAIRITNSLIAAAVDGPPWTLAARVVPLARDQPTVPGEQRRRSHREHLAPPAAGNQARQRSKPQPVGRLVTNPADLAAKDRVLVAHHQKLGVLGHLAPGQHCQAGPADSERAGR
jgi:hypothetical protein